MALIRDGGSSERRIAGPSFSEISELPPKEVYSLRRAPAGRAEAEAASTSVERQGAEKPRCSLGRQPARGNRDQETPPSFSPIRLRSFRVILLVVYDRLAHPLENSADDGSTEHPAAQRLRGIREPTWNSAQPQLRFRSAAPEHRCGPRAAAVSSSQVQLQVQSQKDKRRQLPRSWRFPDS